jgi:arylsulfatase A-like enzyme
MYFRRIQMLWCLTFFVLGFIGCGTAHKQASPEASRGLPNIALILADDMGYGDVQAYNPDSRIPTPNLNRLAREGMRFTDAHSGSGVCSPTRYGVLTGRYSWRTWLKKGVLWPPDDRPLIGPGRLTVAGMLKQLGYRTACIGKWHLGIDWGRDDQGKVDFNQPIRYGPTDVGFDEFFGIAGSLDMIPYVFYYNRRPSDIVTETQEGLAFPKFIREGPRARDFDPETVLDRLTDQAVDFIERSASEHVPFFIYFPLTAPHKPVWPAERFMGKTDLGPYGDFIHQTDWTVGRVLQALEETGTADDTLVVFTSDNGSYMYRIPEDKPDHIQEARAQGYHPSRHTSSFIWRGTKADVWEGGHRVPFIARWPGRIQPQKQCSLTICLTDLMATFAEITKFALPDAAAEDSFSLLSLLSGRDWPTPRAPVIHHSANGTFSLRDGKWKMVFGSGSGGRQKPVGKPFEKPYFLFDLETDPSETTNLIERHPEIAEQLTEKFEAIRQGGRSRQVR